MPDDFSLSSADTIVRSPALNAPSVGITQTTGKLVQPGADAILDQRQALLTPRLVALQKPGVSEFKDRRLHCVERGKHPCDRACPGIGIVRQQARMALGDMEHDPPVSNRTRSPSS